MKKKSTIIIGVIFALALNVSLFAAPKDKVLQHAARARAKKGKVIKVSYKGGNGTVSLAEALPQIRPGTVVQFTGGNYKDPKYAGIKQIEIDQENVVIEGDPTGKRVNLTIVLLKPGCVVRNLWCYVLEAGSVTIVDSRLSPLIYSTKGRTTSYIINSIIHYPKIYANNTNVMIRDCTDISMFTAPRMTKAQWRAGGGGNSYKTGFWGGALAFGEMAKKGEVTVKNSILYTNGYLFQNIHGEAKPLKLILDGNVIHCGQGTIKVKDDAKTPLELKDLKDACRFKKGAKNYLEKTSFTRTPREYYWHWYWSWRHHQNRGIYLVAKPDSRAAKKRIGANIGSYGMPVPPK